MPGGNFTASLTGGDTAAAPRVLPTERCGDYFLATATIDGRGPFRLMLDSGFPVTQLDESAAQALGARRSVEAIEIGALSIRGRIPIGVRDLGDIGRALGTPIDGILGYTTFDDLMVTYDFPAGRVSVEEGTLPDGPGVVAMSRGDRPFVEGRLGGEPERFVVDTGYSGAVALRDLDGRAFETPPRQVGASARVDGVTARFGARLRDDLEFDAFAVRSPTAVSSERRSLLGQAVLRHFAVTLDRKAGRARFAAPGGDNTLVLDARDPGQMRPVIDLPPLRGTGLVLAPAEGHFDVTAVLEGSPAARSPIAAGDRILAIDGTPVHARGCRMGDDEGEPRVLTVARGDARFEVTLSAEVLVP